MILRSCWFLGVLSAKSSAVLCLLHFSIKLATASSAATDNSMGITTTREPHIEHPNAQQWPFNAVPSSQIPFSIESKVRPSALDESNPLPGSPSPYNALLNALEIMESHFFSVSHGTWPHAIDWTAAVMGTQVSASLSTISDHSSLNKLADPHAYNHENIINRYFTQLTSFYFGENAFSLRTQAYDDMLWVVLGWLESIKFVNRHSKLHYARSTSQKEHENWILSWYARQFIPQFAHRARLFYDLASKGWDTTLCGGGMVWNPRLAPYKNAITNQLFIAASVSMYLYFPGDNNASPFTCPVTTSINPESGTHNEGEPPAKAHDDRYLQNAIEAYKWLADSGMRNKAGLYVDGFHIRGWRGGRHGSNGTGHCDLRQEQVYTYNQGVILSGMRGLWEATGNISYLEDGHELINNVIKATGWANRDTDEKYQWAGLGRNGILEEQCDWSGSCSQNGQTFKGIFFHHFTLFCSPLPSDDNDDDEGNGNMDRPWLGDEETRALHQQSCDAYRAWITANARAAWITRDERGEFGQWWGRPWPGRRRRSHHRGDSEYDGNDDGEEVNAELEAPLKDDNDGSIDYRNEGVPIDDIWRLSTADHNAYIRNPSTAKPVTEYPNKDPVTTTDLNDRGRGRTVETQSGGVAVMRALWKLVEYRRRMGREH